VGPPGNLSGLSLCVAAGLCFGWCRCYSCKEKLLRKKGKGVVGGRIRKDWEMRLIRARARDDHPSFILLL